MRGRFGGFTLLELLVVMAIIATLLTLAVPRYFKSLDRSKEAVLKQDLATLRETIDKFHGDTGHYPESLQMLVDRQYLRKIPVDPETNAADRWILVPSEDPEDPGLKDIHSGSDAIAQNGEPYALW